jgi:hypothetical protein
MLDLAHESARDYVFPRRLARGLLAVRLSAPHSFAQIQLFGEQRIEASYAEPPWSEKMKFASADDGDLLTTATFSAKSMCGIAQLVAAGDN